MRLPITLFAGTFLLMSGLAQVPTYVPNNGLVAWWPFNGNANDQSGNGHHGTVNGAMLTADRNGAVSSAFSFDGVNDHINCGNITTMNGQTRLTLSAWINADGNVSSSRIIGQEQDLNSTAGLDLQFATGSGTAIRMNVRNGADAGATSTGQVSTSQWHHIVSVFDGTGASNADRLKLYVDGALQAVTFTGTVPATTSNNAFECWIGGIFNAPTASPWDGALDDLGIWNVALTPAQITALYTGIDLAPCVAGSPCDDGNPCTVGDIYSTPCSSFPIEVSPGSTTYSNTLPAAAALLMNPFKFDLAQRRWRTQYMYLKSEFDANGLCPGSSITQVAFWVNQAIVANNPQRTLQITVTVKHAPPGSNTLVSFENSVDVAAGCMNSAAATLPTVGAAGWRPFAISPFVWDGQRNVIVEIAVGAAAGGGGLVAGGLPIRYTNTGTNLTYGSYTSPLYPAPGTPPCSPLSPTTSPCGPANVATALGDCNANGGAFGASPYRPVIRFGGSVISNNCTCAGTFTDADSDGVCDANDLCTGPEPGTPCNDGNQTTTNDVVNANCVCVGTGAGVRVSVKALLEGAAVIGSSNMQDLLRTNGYVPISEPYSALGYSFVTGGGEVTTGPVLASTGSNAIVDWVLLELRNAGSPGVRSAARAALIQRDGDVVDVDGVSPVTMNAANGNYHVAIRHRTHLGCMTASPVALSASPASIDFTLPATLTYGNNARKNVLDVMLLWSGDVTFSGTLGYTGSGNDRDPILIAVGSTTPNNTVTGYRREDTIMDGAVKYTGASNDRDIILQNVGSTTPNAVRSQQLP